MIPIQRACDVENLADFSRYYQQAWVGWHPTDSEHIMPCYVGGMLDGQNVQMRSLSKDGDGQIRIAPTGFAANWETIKEHIDFGTPDIGMMPDGPTIVFCSYSTPRIAHKGYRGRNTKINDFNTWEIRKKYGSRGSSDRYEWSWFAFNPVYSTLEQAEEKLAKGEAVGVAISRTLGIYSLPKFKHSLLAYKRWTIGSVVSPFLIHLKQEYGDYEEDIVKQTGAEVIVR